MTIQIELSWQKVLADEFKQEYFHILTKKVRSEYLKTAVYPPPHLLFNAFKHCPFDKLKVVILGQDPYFKSEQAMGLSFSVPDEMTIPPSLLNIYKEIRNDFNIDISSSGNLVRWANQGILLLNTTLTVRANSAGSHQGLGWERFTGAVIEQISNRKTHVVFLLWGNYAISKRPLINETKHLVLTAPHPSPLSAYRGFFGCKHFSKTNTYLTDHNDSPINWW